MLLPSDLPLLVLLAVPVVALAGFVHGALGLGFPLVATPLLAMATDVRSAILLTLAPTIAMNLGSIFSDPRWREALRRFWPLPLATLPGGYLGTQVIVHLDPEPFRLLLAAVIAVYLVQDRLRSGGRIRAREPGAFLLVSVGLAGGFLAGLVNVMVPVLIVFALETGLAAALLVALFNLAFLISKTGQVAAFAEAGAFATSYLLWVMPLVPLALLFLALGIRVRRRLDSARYQVWLKVALAAVAAMLVGQYLAGISAW